MNTTEETARPKRSARAAPKSPSIVQRILMRSFANGLGVALKAWVSTLDVRAADYAPNSDAVLTEFHGPAIYVLWHEYLLLPTVLRRGCDLTLLIGMHRDADWLGEVADSFGFKTVRGSSTRGGVKAILQYIREHRHTSLVIATDGPKGPRRVLSSGCIQLASFLQLPIIAAGCGFDRPYRSKSWDRLAFPRAGSRGRMIVGPRVSIPRKLTEAQLNHYRTYIESMLQHINDEAESWAADGIPRLGERAMFAAPHGSVERASSLGIVT
ncbi:MAG: DUF374 domain-containing protein [Pirellula sp.]|jgi:hypothetical protein|nr:DUF374 domain-containing protein [Pirellula sp.]